MMKQSRLGSFGESCVNTAAGFGLSLLLQWAVLGWLMGQSIPLSVNLGFAAVMTVASIGRQFVLRRVFEYFRISRTLSPFMQAVVAERFRQIEAEGWSADHDAQHRLGELARHGAIYAMHAHVAGATPPSDWRWDNEWWKPQGTRRNLVKAAALILAEGDRFDGMRTRPVGELVRGRAA
jgi:hypothetical protein